MGHKLDKVGGKAKKSLSSLKLNKDKKNLDSVPEGRELGSHTNLSHNLDPGVNSDEEEDIDTIFKVTISLPYLPQLKKDYANHGLMFRKYRGVAAQRV